MTITKIRKFLTYARTPSEPDLYGVRGLNALEHFLLHNWWVAVFLLLCYVTYERSLASHEAEHTTLFNQVVQLQHEKIVAQAKQEDLIRQINSQSDPQFIELLLMQELGLVPENQIKVFFTEKSLVQ